MKVHVYGNTLNSAYHLTKILRDKGIDAEMFLDNTSPHQQDYPWWDDSTLNENNLPSWVHYYKTFPFFILPNRRTKDMVKHFSNCDVALVSCYGPILAMKAKVPFVFYSLSSDLNMIDIKKDFKVAIYNSSNLLSKLKKVIKILTFSRLQKKAIVKYSNEIIIYMGYQYNPYIKAFNLQTKTHKLCYPKDIINYGVEMNIDLNEKYKKYKTVFFMFSRHTFASVWNEFKGNDKFVNAYIRFVKEKNPNTLLITANKGVDVSKTKKIIEEAGIEPFIEWVSDMPKYLLKNYQSLPNVVMVDNFWHDKWYVQFPEDKDSPKVGFGFGSLESLASKRPLITAFKDQDFYNNEQPPIFDAFTEEEIYKRLIEIYDLTSVELQEHGNKGYEFVLNWHEQTNVIQTHIDIINKVYKDSKK